LAETDERELHFSLSFAWYMLLYLESRQRVTGGMKSFAASRCGTVFNASGTDASRHAYSTTVDEPQQLKL
jgi:hypothetical protein